MQRKWGLTALFHICQLLGHGLEICDLQLLVGFQHHFINVLEQSALSVSTFLLNSSRGTENK